MMQDCKALLGELRAIDLAILDTGLFLNAYCSEEALTYFKSLTDERARLAQNYVASYGPLIKTDVCDKTSWTNTPWPWELEAN